MKVVHKVGLCIALHDILHVGESYIFPGDGASHTKGKKTIIYIMSYTASIFYTINFLVRFRVIVFRPFMDEVLVGKIRSCSSEGVRGVFSLQTRAMGVYTVEPLSKDTFGTNFRSVCR